MLGDAAPYRVRSIARPLEVDVTVEACVGCTVALSAMAVELLLCEDVAAILLTHLPISWVSCHMEARAGWLAATERVLDEPLMTCREQMSDGMRARTSHEKETMVKIRRRRGASAPQVNEKLSK